MTTYINNTVQYNNINSYSNPTASFNHLIRYLLNILVIYAVFDGMRHFSTFGHYLSGVDDVIIFIIIFITISSILLNGKTTKIFDISISPYILIHVAGIITAYYSVFIVDYKKLAGNFAYVEPYIIYIKQWEVIFLALSLVYWKNKDTKIISTSLVTLFYCSVLWVILSAIFLIWIPPFFEGSMYFKSGRLGFGYPTMDSVMLCFGIVASNFIKNKLCSKLGQIILAIGVIAQATATGLIILLAIFSYKFTFQKKNKYKSVKIVILLLYVFIVVAILINLQWDLVNSNSKFVIMLHRKIGETLDPMASATLSQRFEYLKHSFETHNTIFWHIFGAGPGLAAYLESQYHFEYRANGVVGFLALVWWFARDMYIGRKFEVREKKGTLILSTMVMIFASATLNTFYLVNNFLPFLLFRTLVNKKRDIQYDNYNLIVIENNKINH